MCQAELTQTGDQAREETPGLCVAAAHARIRCIAEAAAGSFGRRGGRPRPSECAKAREASVYFGRWRAVRGREGVPVQVHHQVSVHSSLVTEIRIGAGTSPSFDGPMRPCGHLWLSADEIGRHRANRIVATEAQRCQRRVEDTERHFGSDDQRWRHADASAASATTRRWRASATWSTGIPPSLCRMIRPASRRCYVAQRDSVRNRDIADARHVAGGGYQSTPSTQSWAERRISPTTRYGLGNQIQRSSRRTTPS